MAFSRHKRERRKIALKPRRSVSLTFVFALIFVISLSPIAPTARIQHSLFDKASSSEKPLDKLPAGQNNMSFTSDVTLNLTTGTTINFRTGMKINFTTGITFQFTNVTNPGVIQPCFVGQVINPPPPPQLVGCSWWEILDLNGNPTGFEFHVDELVGYQFHVDQVFPGPFFMQWPVIKAELKIDYINPCDNFVVHDPPEWGPPVCTWWEILEPHEWQGIEFHVDWSNESCEFHVDEVIGPAPPQLIPWPYDVVAEQKIAGIKPCDTFVVTDPAQVPLKCSWWEMVSPKGYSGYEFHVDSSLPNGTFHVDQVTPQPFNFTIPPPYEVTAEKKIDKIEPCTTLWYESPSGYVPQPLDWWEIIYPTSLKGFEFRIDAVQTPYIHIEQVIPHNLAINPLVYEIVVERKIDTIAICNTFKIIDPQAWHPDICSWWKIIRPVEWAGLIFHVDNYNGVNNVFWFHIDQIKGQLAPPPEPWPWNVTAEPYETWYFKPPYPDYAPSGMPDFDQRQWGTYNWTDKWGSYSHCGPVACANSLWWLDSEFEPVQMPPPAINDGFPLVKSYNASWDDHAPSNVQPLIEHLAFLMDTDGKRTGLAHSGTDIHDAEAGLAQYLSWSVVNAIGDVNADGVVNGTDLDIVTAANNTQPGMPGWNLAADIFPASTTYPPITDNVVDQQDINLVKNHLGNTSLFYEHTVDKPTFEYIEDEVKKCEDVVLLIGFWQFSGGTWYSEPFKHMVTVAGVDSENMKIAISDPAHDAFEFGMIPEGRVPIPHVHGVEPPFITHDNAAFVSQDIYGVSPIVPVFVPPQFPCPGGDWTLINYTGWQPTPPFFTVIEAAIVTSPIGVHDVAVTNVTTSKTGCLPMETVGLGHNLTIDVTVENQGDFTENFNVQVKASNTSHSITIGTIAVNSLLKAEKRKLPLNWTVSGVLYDNYTISAEADTVTGETHVADNTYTDGSVLVTMPGDVDGDLEGGRYDVDLFDAVKLLAGYGFRRGEAEYNPNCDIDNDGRIFLFDAVILLGNYGKKYP